MHDYNTILGVIELRLSKVSYALYKTLPDRTERDWHYYDRYKDSGLSLDLSSANASLKGG